MEKRNCQVISNIEATFFLKVCELVTSRDESISSYVRRLVIQDLIDRGLVTEHDMREVLLDDKD